MRYFIFSINLVKTNHFHKEDLENYFFSFLRFCNQGGKQFSSMNKCIYESVEDIKIEDVKIKI